MPSTEQSGEIETCDFCLEPMADHSKAEAKSCSDDLAMVEGLLAPVIEGLGLTDHFGSSAQESSREQD